LIILACSTKGFSRCPGNLEEELSAVYIRDVLIITEEDSSAGVLFKE